MEYPSAINKKKGGFSINPLIKKTNEFIKNGDFSYAFCGGLAIELFLNKRLRSHGDIDISVFFPNRDKIISFMLENGWKIYEARGNGIVHVLDNVNKSAESSFNLFCVKDCPFFHVEPIENGMFKCIIDHTEQTEMNFIKFLFERKIENNIVYRRNPEIVRSVDKAILFNDNIPYLSPELVLLYKAANISRVENQTDFNAVVSELSEEQKLWLKIAVNSMYPDGHRWAFEL